MKILSVGAYLFHADGQTDRHDESDSRVSQFCEGAKNTFSVNLVHLGIKYKHFAQHDLETGYFN
jgi:hypothetical protein